MRYKPSAKLSVKHRSSSSCINMSAFDCTEDGQGRTCPYSPLLSLYWTAHELSPLCVCGPAPSSDFHLRLP